MSTGESVQVAPVRPGVRRAEIAGGVPVLTPWVGVAIAAAGIAGSVLAATLSIRSDVLADPVLNGAARAFLIASWVAAGLVTWRRRPHSRLGLLMIAAAAAFAVTTLTALRGAALFSLGRVAWAGFFVLFIFVLLVFPNGRLDGGAPTLVFRVALYGTVALWLPLVLLSRELPAGVVLTWCAHSCPQNALRVADVGQAVSRHAADVAGALTSLVWIGVPIAIVTRARGYGGLARRAMMPLLICLGAGALCAGVSAFVRHVDGQVPLAFAFGWAAEAAAMVVPFALLLGQARGRLLATAVMRDAVPRFAKHKASEHIQSALAAALHDQSLELFIWMPSENGYFDVHGRRFDPEQVGARSISEIHRDGKLVAAIVHDRALDQDEGVVQSAGAAALLAIENIGLEAELRGSVARLRESLARIASARGDERRRLERDIHDSAQNRLVALRVKLALAEDQVQSKTPAQLRETLAALGEEVVEAIETLRSVTRGIYPPRLASQGVGHALAYEATLTARPVTVLGAAEITRSTPDAEDAAYFCCMEAIQNALKHAGPNASVTIRLEQSGERMTFWVEDDGTGFNYAPSSHAAGLTNMRDRISAAGGTLQITSSPGQGTTVSATIPWPPRQPTS